MNISNLSPTYEVKKTALGWIAEKRCSTLQKVYDEWCMMVTHREHEELVKWFGKGGKANIQYYLGWDPDNIEVQRIVVKLTKEKEVLTFVVTYMDKRRWLAMKQLEGMTPPKCFPFPDECHARERMPYINQEASRLLVESGQSQQEMIALYQHEKEEEGMAIILHENGTYTLSGSDRSYHRLEVAWTELKEIMKKDRLPLLFL